MRKLFLSVLILIVIVSLGFFVFKKFIDKGLPATNVEVKSDGPEGFEHDKDADGILDEKEKELGTSDYEFDTDHDGLTDELEIKLGTNPAKKDTDGDGHGDGIEYLKGYDPLKSSKK